MSVRSSLAEVDAFTAADGSTIRELMHPGVQGNNNQSLAQAIVAPGNETRLHYHATSEELYFIQAGRGTMRLDGEEFEVAAGDTVLIPPGAHHSIRNSGSAALTFLCCCSPAYSDSETFFP